MDIWDKLFKNGSSEICGGQPFKKFEVILSANTDQVTLNVFKGCLPKISPGPFVNTLSHINV